MSRSHGDQKVQSYGAEGSLWKWENDVPKMAVSNHVTHFLQDGDGQFWHASVEKLRHCLLESFVRFIESTRHRRAECTGIVLIRKPFSDQKQEFDSVN